MGHFGFGRAFNLSFERPRSLDFGAVSTRRMPPLPAGGSYSQTINIEGPKGFWGFAAGFLGMPMGMGFPGMGMMGLPGIGMNMNMGLSGLNYSPASLMPTYNNNQSVEAGNQNNKANLQAFFPNCTIQQNPDKTYNIVDKNGDIIHSGSYEDLQQIKVDAGEAKKTEATKKGLSETGGKWYDAEGKEYEWKGSTFVAKETTQNTSTTEDDAES